MSRYCSPSMYKRRRRVPLQRQPQSYKKKLNKQGGKIVADVTEYTALTLDNNTVITHDFIEQCQANRGSVQWDNDGLLMTCQTGYEGYPVNYPEQDGYDPAKPTVYPSTKLMDESDLLYAQLMTSGIYPQNEAQRLRLYFSIVYPLADITRWKRMDLQQLQQLWATLELYYKLDDMFMPQTPRTQRQYHKFYRVPDADCTDADAATGDCVQGNVWLSQETGRPVETGPYMEVVRFGDMDYNLLPDATFTATYLYPAKGSGVFLPVQNSLVAWNKVHALRLLGVSYEDIAYVAGPNFWYWVNDLNEKMVNDENCPRDQSGHRSCYQHYQTNGGDSYYVMPEALETVINNMSAGQSLAKSSKSPYYGLGGSTTGGDALVARLALQQGYDTVQFIREAQLGSSGIVGYEVIDLRVPRQTSALLTRIDPFRLWEAPNSLAYTANRSYGGYADYLVGTQMMQDPQGGLYDVPIAVTNTPNPRNNNTRNNDYYMWLENEGKNPNATCNVIGTPACPSY